MENKFIEVIYSWKAIVIMYAVAAYLLFVV